MVAQRRQASFAVDFVIVTVGINSLALIPFAVASPGDLTSVRCSPEELIWRKSAGKDFVR